MNFTIFCISLVGIVCILYIVLNKEVVSENNIKLEIVLTKNDIGKIEKEEIIEKIQNGEYTNILDIVDSVDIH